jgi:hypothetical protein
MNLLFEGGVYDPRKRARFSVTQETDVWWRWKAGFRTADGNGVRWFGVALLI